MRIELKKGTKENIFFREYWEYIQDYGLIETDEDWDNATKDGNELIKKYGKNSFVSKLVMAFLTEQERRNMEENK